MKILGFETTDQIASVALWQDGEIHCVRIDSTLRHAESVLPAAQTLLESLGLTTADMDAFAVDVGPGSFTGVRIGVCMANALGMAHQKPVVAVNALETLAQPHRSDARAVCALIDARNGNGYGAVYCGDAVLSAVDACVIAPYLAELPPDCILVGTATDCPLLPDASDVVRIAANRTGQKQVSPLYCKLSQAERMWNA